MSDSLADKHARELVDIIGVSNQRIKDLRLEGMELLSERQACSQKIKEACARHRIELNQPPPEDETEGA